jgi:putative ATP-binding cassette transporter
MALIRLLRDHLGWSFGKVVAGAAVAAIMGAATLAILSRAAAGRSETPPALMIGAFLLSVLCYVAAQRYALQLMAHSVELLLHRLRCNIIDLVLKADLRVLEQLGQTTVLTRIDKETRLISSSAIALVNAAQACLLLAFIIAYLALLSPLTLLLCVATLAVGLLLHVTGAHRLTAKIRETLDAEDNVTELTKHAVDGAKEIRLSTARRDSLRDEVVAQSERASHLKGVTQARAARSVVLAQFVFYVAIALVAFAVPALTRLPSAVIVQMVAAILFMNGPVMNIISVLPIYAQADTAASRLVELQARLADTSWGASPPSIQKAPVEFDTIELRDVIFDYGDNAEKSFKVGPISTTIRRGDIVFVTGANGSGKSTFLKLFTALYQPDAGELLLNGKVVQDEQIAAYREMFATVLSDYHLFPELYGLDRLPDRYRVGRRLATLGLTGKARYEGGRFVAGGLSTGQRKRLALLMVLLENRPVLVFDEWAADQDPEFRRWFYREELPRLRAAGRTIVAVTHDDQYFDVADHHVRLAEGHIDGIVPNAQTPGDPVAPGMLIRGTL